MTDEDPLIKGWRVDRRLLRRVSLRRCALGECSAWCCGLGVWVDPDDQRRMLENAALVKRYLPAESQDEREWFDGELHRDGDFPSGWCTGTALVVRPEHPLGTACVFLRQDSRCALQIAGAENGMGPWGLKPFFCALYPLTLKDGQITLEDEDELYIGGGSCQRVDRRGEDLPLYELMAGELKLVLGEDGYTELAALAGSLAVPQ